MLARAVIAAALSLSTPALTQEAATPAPAAAPSAPVTEADVQAQGEAFGARMESLGQEIGAALAASGGDAAAARPEIDRIVARYQAEADAFSATVVGFINAMPDGPQKAGMATALPTIESQIKGAPGMVRDQALASITASPAAPAPTAPAPTPQ